MVPDVSVSLSNRKMRLAAYLLRKDDCSDEEKGEVCGSAVRTAARCCGSRPELCRSRAREVWTASGGTPLSVVGILG